MPPTEPRWRRDCVVTLIGVHADRLAGGLFLTAVGPVGIPGPLSVPVNTAAGSRYPEPVSLRSLPPLLRDEPAMARVVGASTATLAVATPAQAFVLAGLIRLGSRRPVLVVTPTGAAAEQLAHDLEAFTGGPILRPRSPAPAVDGPGRAEVFPAWETLPFERVSPDVSTMGRRLRLLWQMGGRARIAGSGNHRRADQGSAPAARAVAHRGSTGGGGQRGPDRRGRTGRPVGGHGLPTRVDRRAPR